MTDDLLAKFMPQFAAIARTRLQRAIAAATRRDHDEALTTIRDLHALAGEAGLLGLAALVPVARDAEDKAKRVRTTRTDADADTLLAALQELARMIELATSAHTPGVTT
jgi:HPt (histidine-containing phosphotransfer) domain-containing protein